MKLLVVDFDYFFPKLERVEDQHFDGEIALYDWGHSEEDAVFYETIWPIRASSFLARGLELPRCDEDAMDAFWGRFRFAPRASLLMADSNMYAIHERVRRSVDEVWLFDAHHDSGYHPDAYERARTTGKLSCEDWMIGYDALGAALHMRYPAWRHYAMEGEPQPVIDLDRAVDDGQPIDVVFDRVFVCKSPAWVPSWCDDQWERFIASAPLRRRVSVDDMRMRRTFDPAQAQRLGDIVAAQFAGLRERKDSPSE